jgi:hypothetical protein
MGVITLSTCCRPSSACYGEWDLPIEVAFTLSCHFWNRYQDQERIDRPDQLAAFSSDAVS